MFTLEVIDPASMVSKTIARQVSLGRVLNIRAIMVKSKLPKTQLRLNLRKKQIISTKYGQVIIEAKLP